MGRRFVRVAAVVSALVLVSCSTSAAPAAPVAHPIRTPAANHRQFWSQHQLDAARPVLGVSAKPKEELAATAMRVGGLFFQNVDGGHFCTASVVDSPGHNMLVTAAHCVYGAGSFQQNIAFVPDYRKGEAPYGVWTPTSITVGDRWKESGDPDLDVAFIALAPSDGKNIADVVGANQLLFNAGANQVVRVTGYPSGSEEAITCLNQVSKLSASQLRFACDGFADGTSGSPWQATFDPTTETGSIVGLIGGYQYGGDTPDISYSPYFGDDIQELYEKAIAG